MAKSNDRDDETESTYSGEFGERNRNTPGRTPRELGLDPEEVRGHNIIGNTSDRIGDVSFTGTPGGNRKNPDLTPGVEQMGEGGISMSGGRAGGARGNAGTSDSGAGGPEGESRGGPGEYKSTSRGNLDRSVDPDANRDADRDRDRQTDRQTDRDAD
jgi:hypothetical protein